MQTMGMPVPQQPPAVTPSSPRLGAQGTVPQGYARQDMAGLPNGAQMSPQAQAMIEQFRRQQAMPVAQRAASANGVFAGGMQPTAMAPPPPMNLPALYKGGA
jgi:hypothetical protein